MGAWGAKLYDNDMALDVKDEFEKQLRENQGITNKELTNLLLELFSEPIKDIKDGPIFWLALADIQYKYGRLLPCVKEKAIEVIDNNIDLMNWKAESEKLQKQREKVLKELKEELLSPMPSEKQLKPNKIYICDWKLNDVYAYQFESDIAKEKGLFGKWIVMQKVDEGIWHPGHVIPIVRVKLTENDILPKTKEEFDVLEYVQISAKPYESIFIKTEYHMQIAEKVKTKYSEYKFVYLPIYRLQLITTSKRVIPKKLVYIGNFENTLKPELEFIPHKEFEYIQYFKEQIDYINWKDLEKEVINSYFGHNKRQAGIYQKKI